MERSGGAIGSAKAKGLALSPETPYSPPRPRRMFLLSILPLEVAFWSLLVALRTVKRFLVFLVVEIWDFLGRKGKKELLEMAEKVVVVCVEVREAIIA